MRKYIYNRIKLVCIHEVLITLTAKDTSAVLQQTQFLYCTECSTFQLGEISPISFSKVPYTKEN